MAAAGQIHLRVFGPFAAARDPAFCNPARVSSKKGCALLAYLAMCPQQSANRDQLAALLWGNSSDQQARQSLRQALLLLRKDLAPANVIDAGAELVRLVPGTVDADCMEFEALSTSDAFADLERAAGLAQGEFLAGINVEEEGFEEWLRQQRHRLETTATSVLERHARECDRLGKGPQAIAAVERLLDRGGRLREDWQRLALRLYARHRSPAEALAQARAYADLLRRELNVEPEPETQALVEEIRRGAIAPAARPSTDNSAPTAEPAGTRPRAPVPTPAAGTGRLRWRGLATALAAQTSAWLRVRPPVAAAALAVAVGLPLCITAAVTIANDHSVSAAKIARPSSTADVATIDPWQSPRRPGQERADLEARRAQALIPVAVLPFKTYGEVTGPAQLLADMMTDDLVNILSRVPGLRVIARQTSRTYLGQPIDVAAIGSELQVRYILDGSMRVHAGKLRVNVELIDPKTRFAVWTGRIEREGADRHGVQDEIVARLARELQFELYPIESDRRSKDADADALAYRGWAAMSAAFAQSSAEAFKTALDLFDQALQRDPEHVSALMGVGAYHSNMGAQRLDREPYVHLDKAWAILQDVVRRSPGNSAAHHQMGLILQLRGHLPEALDAFERTIEINPSSPGSYAHMGHTLTRLGKSAEGLEHVLYAMRLSPRDPSRAYWLEFAGCSELELGRFQQAIEYFARSRALNPGYPRSLAGLVAAHALAGNASDARALLEKLKALAPDLPTEAFIERYSRMKNHIPKLREGLRLALNSPG